MPPKFQIDASAAETVSAADLFAIIIGTYAHSGSTSATYGRSVQCGPTSRTIAFLGILESAALKSTGFRTPSTWYW